MQKYDVWSILNNNSRWSIKVWEDENNKVWRFERQVVLIKVSKYGVWRNSQQQLPHDARERRLCHESLSGRFRAGSSKPGKTTTTCSSSPSWSRSLPTEYEEIMLGQIISYNQNWGHFEEDEHLVAGGDVHNRIETETAWHRWIPSDVREPRLDDDCTVMMMMIYSVSQNKKRKNPNHNWLLRYGAKFFHQNDLGALYPA